MLRLRTAGGFAIRGKTAACALAALAIRGFAARRDIRQRNTAPPHLVCNQHRRLGALAERKLGPPSETTDLESSATPGESEAAGSRSEPGRRATSGFASKCPKRPTATSREWSAPRRALSGEFAQGFAALHVAEQRAGVVDGDARDGTGEHAR